ncbi:flavin reductase family protein [Pelagirhabdus alkalitolerans]|nr:flavin reductase family protein [Pelagirhabdus alkalitolerans]
MQAINPSHLSGKENYKFLIGSVIPRPIAFVTSLSEDGVLNGAPYSFFNVVSSEPPMISIAVQRKDQVIKHTAQNSILQKEFVVHIVDETWVEKMNHTSATLPYTESEVKKAALTEIPSDLINTPGVKEAKIRMECKLYDHIELPTTDLLLGEVVRYHINSELYESGRIDRDQLDPISRLAGNDYAKIGEAFEIKRPL